MKQNRKEEISRTAEKMVFASALPLTRLGGEPTPQMGGCKPHRGQQAESRHLLYREPGPAFLDHLLLAYMAALSARKTVPS